MKQVPCWPMRCPSGGRFFLACLLCVLSAPGPLAKAVDDAGFESIATEPASLANGSPFLLNVRLAAKAVTLTGSWNGSTVLFFKEHGSRSGEDWRALLGVDVETEPGSYPLTLEARMQDGGVVRATRQLSISAAHYRTGTLSVPQNFVEPDAATQKEIAADKQVKDRVFAQSLPEPQWRGDFAKPVRFPSTDSFGTRRTFNGKLASIHRGMDFRAPAGTPVLAANSGKVILARKLFYEGNCVAIDHGLGLATLYMHFLRIDVHEGELVEKGERLGLSGATGRVTGPHLHFAVRWQGAYLDPAGLFSLRLAGQP